MTSKRRQSKAAEAWINPLGGLGDTLRISGVLKAVVDRDPRRSFHLVRRTAYANLLRGHPAIQNIGYPRPGSRILSTAYWQLGEIGEGINRPFQILARAFGLETPIAETLYLPGGIDPDPVLHQHIPWRRRNILFAPFSESPRKEYRPEAWEQLAERLGRDGHLVIQGGRASDRYIRHTYSVLGLTTPRQFISLVKRADLVVTGDSFAVYAAHLTGTPAVVLWGPTDPKHYGFPEQVHLQAPPFCEKYDCCLGRDYAMNYGTPCFLGSGNSCVNRITVDEVCEAVNKIIA